MKFPNERWNSDKESRYLAGRTYSHAEFITVKMMRRVSNLMVAASYILYAKAKEWQITIHGEKYRKTDRKGVNLGTHPPLSIPPG